MVPGRILVLGASGYIGAQLVGSLLDKGHTVRAGGRSMVKLLRYPWVRHPCVELIETNLLDRNSLQNACRDCGTVYYLVHSMNPYNKDFSEADRRAAQNMIEVLPASPVEQIIYLGGLGENEKTLSKHLRSRMEVLHILHSGKVPATSFRAAMIIGRGSISFEIMGSLVSRFPVMVVPKWVETQSQPIAAANVVYYLVECLTSSRARGEIFDIGGPDIVSYRELIGIYAAAAKLKKRLVVTLPFSIPGHLVAGFIKSYPDYITAPLLDGLRNRMVCQDNRIRDILPQKLLDCRQAVQAAI